MTHSMTTDWASSAFRDALVAMVRRRIPERDAEDVAHAVLAEVIASDTRPDQPEAARRWIWGIARNKIADYYRKNRRETLDPPEGVAGPNDQDVAVKDLLRWAVGELPPGADAEETFRWLLRESEGEKLEEIARDVRLSPEQVRQRVSRMRRFFRTRWALQIAAVGAVAMLLVVYLVLRRNRGDQPGERLLPPPPVVSPSVPDEAMELRRARELRADALRACDDSRWQQCLDGLDQAARLDPASDAQPGMSEARRRATEGLARERNDGGLSGLPQDLGNGTLGTTGTSGGDSLGSGTLGTGTRSSVRRPRRGVGSSMPGPGTSGP